MNWLTDLVKPGLKTTVKRGVSADIWEKCPGCGELLYEADLPQSLYVCGACGHHLRWGIDARLAHLLDAKSMKAVEVPEIADDPLGFRDRKKYKDRLKDARKGGVRDAFRVVRGAVEGHPLVVVALDFDFMAGSMSRAVGQAVVVAAQTALADKVPLLCITASGGARMQEGTLSLMQMARTTAAIVALKEAGLPYLTLLCDPTTGGVTASFAMQGDVHMAEPGALIGFAGPRVIEQTIRQTLPEGFQRAEYLLEHGMVDMVVPRKEQRDVLGRLLAVVVSGINRR
ncbi:MAG: acetyl-CoA carboxylase carboxyltransferase subunit beta [Pseudomonadaceae bacterium]|nr:acetyl-CoA carboxylase carboxyltransferase subunit beta [Pseudomonadaceae bacterium]